MDNHLSVKNMQAHVCWLYIQWLPKQDVRRLRYQLAAARSRRPAVSFPEATDASTTTDRERLSGQLVLNDEPARFPGWRALADEASLVA